MPKSTIIIAFDQHAATTVAAVLLPGQRTPALHHLTSDIPTILRLVERVRRAGPVQCCYEAGPCGFDLQRALTAHDIPCDVIAPNSAATRRSHQNRPARCRPARPALSRRRAHRDSHSHRAGRSRTRSPALPRGHSCRPAARPARLSKFLLRHGRRFTATKKAWTKRHAAWLQAQRWPLPALEQTHRASVRAVDEAVGRLHAVDTERRDLLTIEPLRARVARLRCFRGIDDLTALTIAAELGDARRFPSAPRVMACTGLVPSEHSSGAKHARGAITKTGNAHLRRVLVESAWHDRHHPFLGRALRLRQRGAPAPVIDQA